MISIPSFGFAIAFIAPGAVVLWGISRFSADVREWFGIAAEAETSVGGFLFVLLGAVAVGVFVSGVRWAIIDKTLERFASTKMPELDRSKLKSDDVRATYETLTEMYYRYYQFYANMLIAMVAAYSMWLADLGLNPLERPAASAGVITTGFFLFISAQDALSRYYRHVKEIL